MFRGVLLDVDGTLVDSNDAHARAWSEALVAHGFSVPFAAIRARIGMGGDQLVSELTKLPAGDDLHQAVTATRAMRFRTRWLAEVKPLAGARAFVEKLRANDYPYVLATSSKTEELDAILAAGGLLDLCPERTTADDVDRAKPDPDILEVALKKLGLTPAEAVMIGDTPYDLIAAKRAKIAAIAVTTGGFPLESLRDAIAIYRGPGGLVLAWDGSPLGRA